MIVKVTGRSDCYDNYHDGKQYGDWHTYSNASIESVTIDTENGEREYDSEYFKVIDGATTVWVLWMSYSSGDSFGNSTGNLDILHAFGDKAVAEKAFETFKANSKEYSIKIKDDFGTEVSLYNNGAGYFESIESLNLDPFIVGEGGNLSWRP